MRQWIEDLFLSALETKINKQTCKSKQLSVLSLVVHILCTQLLETLQQILRSLHVVSFLLHMLKLELSKQRRGRMLRREDNGLQS